MIYNHAKAEANFRKEWEKKVRFYKKICASNGGKKRQYGGDFCRRLHRLEEAKRCGDQKRQENTEIQPMTAEHRACAGISHTGFSCIENSFPATEICLPHDSFCASHKRNHRY